MSDRLPARRAFEHVEAVDAPRVVVVEPRGDDAAGAQFATVLVGHDVVRVVWPRAVVLEIAKRLAVGEPAERRPVPPVRQPCAPREHLVDVGAGHRLPAARQIHGGGRGCDDDGGGIDLRDVAFDHVVADGVVDGGADHLGPAGHLRVGRRIELDLIEVTLGIDDAVAGSDARALALYDWPAADVHRVPTVRAAHHLLERWETAADTVGKPRRIGHLADRIDVHRQDVASIAWTEEGVVGEVVAVAALDRLRRSGVQRAIVVDLDRVVREELRRRATTGDRAHEQRRRHTERGQPPRAVRRHGPT